MFTSTRKHFIDRGVLFGDIHRRQGFDRVTCPDLKGFEVVTKYVRHRFCLEAQAAFDAQPKLSHICFAEDDCRLTPGVDAKALMEACRTAPTDKVLWVGYGLRAGQPKVGAHLVAFGRDSLPKFRAESKQACSSKIQSFDTMLHAFWKAGLVIITPQSMAHQGNHKLKGRY